MASNWFMKVLNENDKDDLGFFDQLKEWATGRDVNSILDGLDVAQCPECGGYGPSRSPGP